MATKTKEPLFPGDSEIDQLYTIFKYPSLHIFGIFGIKKLFKRLSLMKSF